MSFKLPENVHETTTTTGTGTIVLSGAVSGKYAFSSQLTNGDTVFYVISDTVDIEAGVGTYTNSVGQQISRDTVYYSTNGNSLVNWGSGTRNVMCSMHGKVLESLLDPTASNGFIADIGQNVYARRSIAAGSNVQVSNGDGVSGNPTVSVTGGSGSGLDSDTLRTLTPGGVAALAIPAGSAMLFHSTNAPTGWTKQVTYNDRALRVVSGTVTAGGTVAFSTAFASKSVAGTVDGHALSTSELNHRHIAPSVEGGSSFAYSPITAPYGLSTTDSGTCGGGGGAGLVDKKLMYTSYATTTTAQAHSHGFTGTPIDLTVQYVDLILATKDAY